MDAANKKELLDWLNNTLDLNVSKIEDTASGAIACQLVDVLYPNRVPMSKVHWGAEEPHEFMANYKLLVGLFAELRIDKTLDVNKMIHCRPKELFELIAWFKSYYESIGGSRAEDYDCVGQRAKGKGGRTYVHSRPVSKTPRTPRTPTTPLRRSFSRDSPSGTPGNGGLDTSFNGSAGEISAAANTPGGPAPSTPSAGANTQAGATAEQPVAQPQPQQRLAPLSVFTDSDDPPVAAAAPQNNSVSTHSPALPSPKPPASPSRPGFGAAAPTNRTASPSPARRRPSTEGARSGAASPSPARRRPSAEGARNGAASPSPATAAAVAEGSANISNTPASPAKPKASGIPPRTAPRTTKAAETRLAAAASARASGAAGGSGTAGAGPSTTTSRLPPIPARPRSTPGNASTATAGAGASGRPSTTRSTSMSATSRATASAARTSAAATSSRTAARTTATSRSATTASSSSFGSRSTTNRSTPSSRREPLARSTPSRTPTRTTPSRTTPSRTTPSRTPAAPKVDVQALQVELAETKKLLEAEKQLVEAEKQNSETMREELLGMVRERDFYFDKLRAIEIFIQDYQESGKSNECTASVLRIMYATQDGFVTSDEEALAAVLQQAEKLIGPEAAAATASAQQYIHRRASFNAGALGDAVANLENGTTSNGNSNNNNSGMEDILDAIGTITINGSHANSTNSMLSANETNGRGGDAAAVLKKTGSGVDGLSSTTVNGAAVSSNG